MNVRRSSFVIRRSSFVAPGTLSSLCVLFTPQGKQNTQRMKIRAARKFLAEQQRPITGRRCGEARVVGCACVRRIEAFAGAWVDPARGQTGP